MVEVSAMADDCTRPASPGPAGRSMGSAARTQRRVESPGLPPKRARHLLWLLGGLLASQTPSPSQRTLRPRSRGNSICFLPYLLLFPPPGSLLHQGVPGRLRGTQAFMFEQVFKSIDNVLRREVGCATELDYTEQMSWLLFLKYLDDLENYRATEALLQGRPYTFILASGYRWKEWSAPSRNGQFGHDLLAFINQALFPYLQRFRQKASSPNTIEHKIGEIFGEIHNKFFSGDNLREAIYHIDMLRFGSEAERHELLDLYESKIQ